MSTLWAQARQSFRGWDPRAPWDIGSGSRVEAEEETGGGGGGGGMEEEEEKEEEEERRGE